MNKILLSFLIAALFIACEESGSTDQDSQTQRSDSASDTAISSFFAERVDGSWIIEQQNSSMVFIDQTSRSDTSPMMLKVTKSFQIEGREETQSHFEVKGFKWDGEAFRDKSWTVRQEAKNYELFKGMIVFSTEGHVVGGLPGNQTFFMHRLSDGKAILDYTYDRLTVNVLSDPQDIRFLSYTDRLAAGPSALRFAADSLLVGLVHYADMNGKIFEVEVRLKDISLFDLVPPYTPRMELFNKRQGNQLINYNKSLLLWPSEEKLTKEDLSGFGISLTYFIGQTLREIKVEIPITSDSIDPNGIIFDPSIFELVPGTV
jgi:hypothetical protein